MQINKLLQESKEIWGDDKLSLSEIIVRIGVVFGDVCRWERNAKKDIDRHTDKELQKELGNLIFSTVRFCDDLGYDPEKCIQEAIKCQREFKK